MRERAGGVVENKGRGQKGEVGHFTEVLRAVHQELRRKAYDRGFPELELSRRGDTILYSFGSTNLPLDRYEDVCGYISDRVRSHRGSTVIEGEVWTTIDGTQVRGCPGLGKGLFDAISQMDHRLVESVRFSSPNIVFTARGCGAEDRECIRAAGKVASPLVFAVLDREPVNEGQL